MSSQNRSFYLLAKSALTGALGGLLFGFDTAVISGVTHSLQLHYALTEGEKGFTVAIALYGTVLGAIFAGPLGQKIGSRAALRIMAVLYVISSLGCAFAGPWWTFLFFRFLGGLGIGGSSVLGPVYIAELAPAKWRGRLVGLFQINIVIGILLAYLSNAVVAHFALGAIEWRVQLGVGVLPAMLFMALLYTVPHSSRWLISQNRLDEAYRILAEFGSPDSQAEVDAIAASIRAEGGTAQHSLFQSRYAKLIFLAVSIGLFNQLSGINAILYYLNDIFGFAGFSSVSGNVQAVFVGLANLVFTLIGIAIIDKIGRKPLLLIGAVGTCLALSGVAWVFHTNSHLHLLLPFLVFFIASFALSQGAVIWVYLSEVFPTNVRSKGQSLGSSSHWIANGIIANIFPYVAAYSKAMPFAFFAAMMVVQFFTVLIFYPETKGQTLEGMQAHLGLH
ncbi:sugar porter family MFS transporter [Edaphobacter flagellatus]|uniref:sugar porter family MFS transporter n=1 Tax=Edaphobacter flagellatus TaxID=1933044 RepID=UPI0021B3B9B7|nr:sugar porter family MFS transporter [Edaphobacter flagellatus]